MSVINFFDASLNLLIFSVLFKSGRKDSLFGVIPELLNQLLDRFFAIRVLLLDWRMGMPGIL